VTRLLSVNVGLPCGVTWKGETVRNGGLEFPVAGRRTVSKLNIDGDGHGGLAGGKHRALFVSQMGPYYY
jgi:hypothetical protein